MLTGFREEKREASYEFNTYYMKTNDQVTFCKVKYQKYYLF